MEVFFSASKSLRPKFFIACEVMLVLFWPFEKEETPECITAPLACGKMILGKGLKVETIQDSS